MRATSPATGTPPRGRPNTSRGSGNRSSTPASTRRQPSTCPAWRRFRNRDPLALRAIALLPAGLREPALQLLGKLGEVAADVDERELRQDRRRRLPPGLRRAPPSVGFAHNRPWPVWTWDYHFRGWVRRWRCQSVPSSSLPTRSSPSR